MQPLTAVVLGSSGLIGSHVVQQLLADAAFSKVRILVRRKAEWTHPKLEVAVADFNNVSDFKKKLGSGDCIFSCIGTTQKQVKGDQAMYRSVDFDIPVNAARWGKEAGFTKFLLISSVGANSTSSNFYLRLKGEVEKEISSLNYTSFQVFRPGILFGKRAEFRPGEIIGKIVMQIISPLLVAGLSKYKGIRASDVAKAMVAAAKANKGGTEILHYSDIIHLAANAN
ncbi:MAG TPA: NAD(P)H-binding protein [Segetibacter sp.]